MTIKPYLKFSCDEDWNKMKIGVCSRHCKVCNIDVMDFTNKSRTEILEYIYTNKNQNICGRFRKSQLDFTYDEMFAVVEGLASQKSQRNFAFWALTVGAIGMLSCNTPSENKNTSQYAIGEVTLASASVRDSLNSCEQFDQDTPGFEDPMIMGEFVRTVCDENGVYYITDKMPEFEEGIDSLNNYISKHITYPEWEKKKGIGGIVVASFIIDAEGKITDPSIIKSVDRSKNFDTTVLRMLENMPLWIPVEFEGTKVPVHFNLPIEFKLK